VSYDLHGARSGVWPWPRALPRRSVVYSFGVGDNATWEEEVVERHGARVFAFDPTPVSVAWVRGRTWPEGLKFHDVGLGVRDGEAWFRAPRGGANYVPVAAPAREGDDTVIRAIVSSLHSAMQHLGHRHLDVLKLDIEGGEYEVLASLDRPVPATCVLVEFHHGMEGHTLAETAEALETLRRGGFRLFWISDRGLEFGLWRGGGPGGS